MTKVKKIKKDELIKLQELFKNFNAYKLKLGELEIEKHLLLHNSSNAQLELQNYQEKLSNEYGDVVININDGKILENELDKKN